MSGVDIGQYSKRLVQYFWDPMPRNDDPSGAPVWCLGRRYEYSKPTKPTITARSTRGPSIQSSPPPPPTSQSPDASSSSAGETSLSSSAATSESLAYDEDGDYGWPVPFLDDFESRIWMSYRSNFPPIAKSQDAQASSALSFGTRMRNQLSSNSRTGGFTSDTGFGCMIRSAQCLLANALLVLRLGRDWRRRKGDLEEKKLLALFADDPRAPFSIHNFVEYGAYACGKYPGEWFGPSAAARCIQNLTNNLPSAGLKVYMTGDGSDVYEDSVFKLAKDNPQNTFQAILLLVGIRLGIDRVTPVYWEALVAALQLPQSIGIAGGRPRASHYFVGAQGHTLFYLDPHQTKPGLPYPHNDKPETYDDEEHVSTFHTRRLRRIHVKEMDPSMLIAFLIRNEDDWHAWREGVNAVQGKPVIRVADVEPSLHGGGGGGGDGDSDGRHAGRGTGERQGAIDEVETLDDDDDTE